MTGALVLGLALVACAGAEPEAGPRRITFAPGEDGETPTVGEPTPDGVDPTTSGTPSEATSGGDTVHPQPVEASQVHVVRLTADGHHLGAELGRVTPRRPASGSQCDVGPDDHEMIQCEVVRGGAGLFAVWTGQEPSSRGLRVEVHRVAGDDFVLVAQSLLTRDFRELALRAGEAAGEGYVLVDYALDGAGNLHDFDVVTWADGQAQPGTVASLHQIVSPRVTVEGDTYLEALNYGDGADLCCPNFKDVMHLFRDPQLGWSVRVETVPIRDG